MMKAHQHSAGTTTQQNESIGKSVAGNTTKIHMAVDSYGLPVHFELTGGEVHECKLAPEFIERLPHSDYTIADKGYDSEEVRQVIRKNNSITGNADMDWGLYKYRH